jgi:MoaA/NifB/PqqE/SkfB family radical SAM enzyme
MQNGYSYTSNDVKLFKHLNNLKKIQNKKAAPIMFCIAETNKCNADCIHCCFADRDKTAELNQDALMSALDQMSSVGADSIEHTGGGEPTMYKGLNAVILHANYLGLKQGMNTNCLKVPEHLRYDLISWVRIGMNVFDGGKQDVIKRFEENAIAIKKQTKVSACYIVTDKCNNDWINNIENVIAFAERNEIPTRITPDCIKHKPDIDAIINKIKLRVAEYKCKHVFVSDFNIYLGDRKNNNCMIHMMKPFLYTDGWVYCCPSSELAIENTKDMLPKYRVCRMEDIQDYYNTKFEVFTHTCSYCKYTKQNELLSALIEETTDNEFV